MSARAIRLPASGLTLQLVRFAIAGLAVTMFSALIYLALSTATPVPPFWANIAAHVCGVLFGFQIHSRWSFREDTRHNGVERLMRFAAGSGASLLLNSLWVWVFVTNFAGPAWVPIPAMLFVTPLASFAINRVWVFARD